MLSRRCLVKTCDDQQRLHCTNKDSDDVSGGVLPHVVAARGLPEPEVAHHEGHQVRRHLPILIPLGGQALYT